MNRRKFLENSIKGSAAIFATSGLLSFQLNENNVFGEPKISLAQWSLHRALEKGLIKPENFAAIAHDQYKIDAVEYVNAFYEDKAEDQKFWNELKNSCSQSGVKSLLIMVDNEGDLGDPNDNKRMKAVQNHLKWIEAAQLLGCHSIRVNAFGSGERSALKAALVDGLGSLAEKGSENGINVLIENHGLHTSDAAFINSIIDEVDNDFLGTLPDFGNWCLNKEWGSTQGGNCTEVYDPYKGVEQMLPYAKGVSAKSYEFDEAGKETTIDFKKMFQLVKKSGFEGYIGIEYEGSKLSEEDGIRATKKLIELAWAES